MLMETIFIDKRKTAFVLLGNPLEIPKSEKNIQGGRQCDLIFFWKVTKTIYRLMLENFLPMIIAYFLIKFWSIFSPGCEISTNLVTLMGENASTRRPPENWNASVTRFVLERIYKNTPKLPTRCPVCGFFNLNYLPNWTDYPQSYQNELTKLIYIFELFHEKHPKRQNFAQSGHPVRCPPREI
jgi:hypothetical protein